VLIQVSFVYSVSFTKVFYLVKLCRIFVLSKEIRDGYLIGRNRPCLSNRIQGARKICTRKTVCYRTELQLGALVGLEILPLCERDL
jgi:hypothetical protein